MDTSFQLNRLFEVTFQLNRLFEVDNNNKSACKICGKKFYLGRMRKHTQSPNQMTTREYKDKFKQEFYTLEDPIFHRCGVCQRILLLDSDSISNHLNNNSHGMTHSEYNQMFVKLVMKGKLKGNREVDSSKSK